MTEPDASRSRGLSPSELHPLARLPEDWRALLDEWGERPFRGDQVFRWLHGRREMDPSSMTDLPKSLRERLSGLGRFDPLQEVSVKRSSDGTRKLLVEISGGGRVECVLIPMTRDAEADADAAAAPEEDEDGEAPREQRVTLCISTQHGCAMGCTFCASGRAGLLRGLGAAEIVAQVHAAARHLEPGERLRNLVFMGMGEPLHHYDETSRAIRLLSHSAGADMSPRRMTVSTVGLVPGIRRLGEDFAGKVGLAVSLHAPNDEVRSRIMPMNRRYPVRDLLDALRAYPLPKRRRITIEYTLIAGVNDAPEHARELAAQLRGLRTKVNLIPMNPVAGSNMQAPEPDRVEQFHALLSRERISCSVRKRRGDDVDAACGQLALQSPEVGNPAAAEPASDARPIQLRRRRLPDEA